MIGPGCGAFSIEESYDTAGVIAKRFTEANLGVDLKNTSLPMPLSKS